MIFLRRFLLTLFLLPPVGWAGMDFCISGDGCYPDEATYQRAHPSPCVRRAQQLLSSNTTGNVWGGPTERTLKAIAFLLLDQRLGADCTVEP